MLVTSRELRWLPVKPSPFHNVDLVAAMFALVLPLRLISLRNINHCAPRSSRDNGAARSRSPVLHRARSWRHGRHYCIRARGRSDTSHASGDCSPSLHWSAKFPTPIQRRGQPAPQSATIGGSSGRREPCASQQVTLVPGRASNVPTLRENRWPDAAGAEMDASAAAPIACTSLAMGNTGKRVCRRRCVMQWYCHAGRQARTAASNFATELHAYRACARREAMSMLTSVAAGAVCRTLPCGGPQAQ